MLVGRSSERVTLDQLLEMVSDLNVVRAPGASASALKLSAPNPLEAPVTMFVLLRGSGFWRPEPQLIGEIIPPLT